MKKGIVVLLAGALLLAVGLGAACGSSKDSKARDDIAALQTQVAGGGSDNVDMVVALQALSASGLHELDTSANDDNTLEAGASGGVKLALAAVSAVQWPSDIAGEADGLKTALNDLLTALATDDVEQVKAPAHAAHEAYHAFTDAVYGVLEGPLGLPTQQPDEDEMTTPMAEETPMATATQ